MRAAIDMHLVYVPIVPQIETAPGEGFTLRVQVPEQPDGSGSHTKKGNTAKVAMSCSAVEVLSTVALTSRVASEIAWQNVYVV